MALKSSNSKKATEIPKKLKKKIKKYKTQNHIYSQ